MSIILTKDIFKKQFDKRQGIAIMIFIGIILFLTIISNIQWISSYDVEKIKKIVAKNIDKENPSLAQMDSYVRGMALYSIISNTLILGLFSGMIWWSISSKRLGLFFSIFWFVAFIINAISLPFYSINLDTLTIFISIMNGIAAIIMFFSILDLLKMRSRIREDIARRG